MFLTKKRRFTEPREWNPSASKQKCRSIFAMVLFIQLSQVLCAQRLTVLPLQPKPGDTLTIVYDPAGGVLENDSIISCQVFIYRDFELVRSKQPLIKVNGRYEGSTPTDSLSQLIFFSFSANKKADKQSNGITRFYRKGVPVEGANYLSGDLYLSSSGKNLYGFDKEHRKALSFYEQEMAGYPDGRFRLLVLQGYLKSLLIVDSARAIAETKNLLDSIDKKGKLSDLDLLAKFRIYEAINLGDSAQQMLADIQKNFPSSPVIFSKRYKEAISPQAAEEMEKLCIALIRDYDMVDGKEFNSLLPSVYAALCQQYSREINAAKFYEYAGKLTSPAAVAYNYYLAATAFSDAGAEIREAENLSKRSIDLADSLGLDKKNAAQYAEYLATRGKILSQQHRYNESLEFLEKACSLVKGNSAHINLQYAQSLANTHQYEKALPLFQQALEEVNIDSTTERLFRQSWTAAYGNVEKFGPMLDTLLLKSSAKRRELVKKELLNEKAPLFQLKDLNGKNVDLAQLRGKVVVLDFWADWCIPCKLAFPGMQQLVNFYSPQKDIVFLFIHTLDNFESDIKFKVKKYLKTRNFTFRVLVDERSKENVSFYKVAGPYGVKVLPQKIIIDKNGIIRFRSSGYEGSSEKLLSKMKDLIDITRAL